jgi:hypothetical protein
MCSGVRQFAHRLEAGKLGSQEAESDEASVPSSIQAFQPSSYFTDTCSSDLLRLSGGASGGEALQNEDE